MDWLKIYEALTRGSEDKRVLRDLGFISKEDFVRLGDEAMNKCIEMGLKAKRKSDDRIKNNLMVERDMVLEIAILSYQQAGSERKLDEIGQLALKRSVMFDGAEQVELALKAYGLPKDKIGLKKLASKALDKNLPSVAIALYKQAGDYASARRLKTFYSS